MKSKTNMLNIMTTLNISSEIQDVFSFYAYCNIEQISLFERRRNV